LKAVECLPIEDTIETSLTASSSLSSRNTESEEDVEYGGSEMNWSLPSKTVLGSDLDRQYIPAYLVRRYLKKSYVHSSIYLTNQVANDLGVGTLNCEDLVHILVGVCKDNALQPNSDSDSNGLGLNWLCKWFHLFFIKIKEYNEKSMISYKHSGGGFSSSQIPESMLTKLRKLAIFPLEDNNGSFGNNIDDDMKQNIKLTSINDGVLFEYSKDFPVKKQSISISKSKYLISLI
jgi:hypothetical protein